MQTCRDLGLVLEYKSRNEEFRDDPPPKTNVTLPTFIANEIKNDKIYELFGSFTMDSDEINIIEQGVKSKSRAAKPFISPTTDEQDMVKHYEVYIKRMLNINEYLLTRFITYLFISLIRFSFSHFVFLPNVT